MTTSLTARVRSLCLWSVNNLVTLISPSFNTAFHSHSELNTLHVYELKYNDSIVSMLLPYLKNVIFNISCECGISFTFISSVLNLLSKQVSKHCFICSPLCTCWPSCSHQDGTPTAPSPCPAELPSILQFFHLLLWPLWELLLWRLQPLLLRWWLWPGRLQPPLPHRGSCPQPVCAAG